MVESISLYNEASEESLYLSMNDSPYYILKSCDFGQVEAERQTYSFINQIGAQVSNIVLGPREISIAGWVISNDGEEAMTERKAFLNRFFNPRDLIKVTYKEKTISFYPDTSIKYTTAEKSNNEVVCQFEIDGMCPYPLFGDEYSTDTSSYQMFGGFMIPLTIPEEEGVNFGYIAKTKETLLQIDNKGDIEIGMKFTIEAPVQKVVNPLILNIKTGEYLKLNVEIEVGEKVIISTVSGDKYIKCIHTDETETNYYPYFDLDSTWLNLAKGMNYLMITADEGTAQVLWSVEYYNKYLEVQEWD